jgi:hypothetical protein
MSTTKRQGNGGGPNKSEFIRQNPNLSAAEVVATAKEQGIDISAAFVHTVRSRSGAVAAQRGRRRQSASAGGANASAFIRDQLANGKSTADIISEGKKAGLNFSRSLVYAVKAASAPKRAGKARTVATSAARPAKSAAAASDTDNEVLFRKLAFEMGLVRARALLDDLERRLVKLLNGSG